MFSVCYSISCDEAALTYMVKGSYSSFELRKVLFEALLSIRHLIICLHRTWFLALLLLDNFGLHFTVWIWKSLHCVIFTLKNLFKGVSLMVFFYLAITLAPLFKRLIIYDHCVLRSRNQLFFQIKPALSPDININLPLSVCYV